MLDKLLHGQPSLLNDALDCAFLQVSRMHWDGHAETALLKNLMPASLPVFHKASPLERPDDITTAERWQPAHGAPLFLRSDESPRESQGRPPGGFPSIGPWPPLCSPASHRRCLPRRYNRAEKERLRCIL